MALHPKLIARENDLYPIWDVDALNNVGSDLAVGAVVLIDMTLPGSDNSIISPGTSSNLALSNTRMKAVVLSQPSTGVLLKGAVGRVRVQGPVLVGVATGVAFTAGDPVLLYPATNATGTGLVTSLAVTAPGTNSTYIAKSIGSSLATTASLGTAQTMLCLFDGTDINAIYLKD